MKPRGAWAASSVDILPRPPRIQSVREQAEKYGLFLTGGSGFHGFYSEKPVPLGGSPKNR
jgi:hypothetical protein